MNQDTIFTLPCEGPEKIRVDLLKTFPYQGQRQRISYVTHEFSAVCPFSGLPDLATIEIIYIPNASCLELKSLKLYLVSFRSIGMYQEHITDKLFSDINSILKPEYLQIVTRYATRGGIDAVCEISTDSL